MIIHAKIDNDTKKELDNGAGQYYEMDKDYLRTSNGVISMGELLRLINREFHDKPFYIKVEEAPEVPPVNILGREILNDILSGVIE